MPREESGGVNRSGLIRSERRGVGRENVLWPVGAWGAARAAAHQSDRMGRRDACMRYRVRCTHPFGGAQSAFFYSYLVGSDHGRGLYLGAANNVSNCAAKTGCVCFGPIPPSKAGHMLSRYLLLVQQAAIRRRQLPVSYASRAFFWPSWL